MHSNKRLFFIDLLRVSSLILVFLHHVLAQFKAGNFPITNYFPTKILGYSLGDIAVSCFIVISGFSLYYTHKDKLNPLSFIKKNLFKLYLPYWIYFFFFTIISLVLSRTLSFRSIPYIIFGATGLDNIYNSFFYYPYHQLSDWFLGFILIFYLLIPLIFIVYNKIRSAKLTLFLTGLFSLSMFILLLETPWADKAIRFPLVRVFEFVIGVYLADFFFRKNHIFKPPQILWFVIPIIIIIKLIFNSNPITNWLTLSLFFIPIFYLFYFLDLIVFKKIPLLMAKLVNKLANLSYVFFLCHHQIIFYYRALRPYHLSMMPYNLYGEMLLLLVVIIITTLIITKIAEYGKEFVSKKINFGKI